MKYNGLDVYDITIGDGNVGIGATSLVTLPATESSFLHFNEDKPQFMFANEEKKELVGAIMIPDKLIFRKINDEAFYVNFTKEVIKELTSKMLTSGTAGLFTVEHKSEVKNGDVETLEVWVKESEVDKSVEYGLDEPIGTAFMKVKVNSDPIWNAVKENGLNGFSIELDASIKKKNELFNKTEEKQEPKMTLKDVFSNSVAVNGIELHFNGELAEKAYIVQDVEGVPTAYTGEFSHEEVSFKVENGVVTEAIDIKLSTDEAIKGLATKFEGLSEKIEAILSKEKEIEEKEAELELLKSQFSEQKADFEKSKGEKRDVKVNLSAQMAANGSGYKEWMSKF